MPCLYVLAFLLYYFQTITLEKTNSGGRCSRNFVLFKMMSQTLMEINPQEIVVPSNMLVYPLARNGHEAKEHCVPIEI